MLLYMVYIYNCTGHGTIRKHNALCKGGCVCVTHATQPPSLSLSCIYATAKFQIPMQMALSRSNLLSTDPLSHKQGHSQTEWRLPLPFRSSPPPARGSH